MTWTSASTSKPGLRPLLPSGVGHDGRPRPFRSCSQQRTIISSQEPSRTRPPTSPWPSGATGKRTRPGRPSRGPGSDGTQRPIPGQEAFPSKRWTSYGNWVSQWWHLSRTSPPSQPSLQTRSHPPLLQGPHPRMDPQLGGAGNPRSEAPPRTGPRRSWGNTVGTFGTSLPTWRTTTALKTSAGSRGISGTYVAALRRPVQPSALTRR
jgi:hypothetical protein